jgi:hypothetical protein
MNLKLDEALATQIATEKMPKNSRKTVSINIWLRLAPVTHVGFKSVQTIG